MYDTDNIWGVDYRHDHAEWAKAKKARTCMRCLSPVPPEEYAAFFDTGLCSFCLNSAQKAKGN